MAGFLKSRKGEPFWPVLRVRAVVEDDRCPYSGTARHIALILALMLNTNDDGHYTAFPSLKTLARRSGRAVYTVRRALDELCGEVEGVPALFYRAQGQRTRRGGRDYGVKRTFTYTLVENPRGFDLAAAKRNRARMEEREPAATIPPVEEDIPF